jgi:hypothetical protein
MERNHLPIPCQWQVVSVKPKAFSIQFIVSFVSIEAILLWFNVDQLHGLN